MRCLPFKCHIDMPSKCRLPHHMQAPMMMHSQMCSLLQGLALACSHSCTCRSTPEGLQKHRRNGQRSPRQETRLQRHRQLPAWAALPWGQSALLAASPLLAGSAPGATGTQHCRRWNRKHFLGGSPCHAGARNGTTQTSCKESTAAQCNAKNATP